MAGETKLKSYRPGYKAGKIAAGGDDDLGDDYDAGWEKGDADAKAGRAYDDTLDDSLIEEKMEEAARKVNADAVGWRVILGERNRYQGEGFGVGFRRGYRKNFSAEEYRHGYFTAFQQAEMDGLIPVTEIARKA